MYSHSAYETLRLVSRQINSTNATDFNSTFGINATHHCNTTTCDYDTAYIPYSLSLAATLTFLALFGGTHISFIVTYLMTHRELGFSATIAAGTLFETVGWSGRLISWFDQWQLPPYLLQLCCLTIGPVFINAAIYVCMMRLVSVYGEQNWPTDLRTLLKMLIPSDVISAILQTVGSVIATIAVKDSKSPNLGAHILLAGVSLQVVNLAVFLISAIIFGLRCRQRRLFDPDSIRLRSTRRFKGFVCVLAQALLAMFARSVYRVLEYSTGWRTHWTNNPWWFLGMEGATVAVACLGLNFFNPAYVFEDVDEDGASGRRIWWGRDKKGTYVEKLASPMSMFED